MQEDQQQLEYRENTKPSPSSYCTTGHQGTPGWDSVSFTDHFLKPVLRGTVDVAIKTGHAWRTRSDLQTDYPGTNTYILHDLKTRVSFTKSWFQQEHRGKCFIWPVYTSVGMSTAWYQEVWSVLKQRQCWQDLWGGFFSKQVQTSTLWVWWLKSLRWIEVNTLQSYKTNRCQTRNPCFKQKMRALFMH